MRNEPLACLIRQANPMLKVFCSMGSHGAFIGCWQVVAQMQRSHVQMLDTMIAQQQQELTEKEVGSLHSLRDRAIGQEGSKFNTPEYFEKVTNEAMEAQRRIIIEAVKNQRMRMNDAQSLRSAANFAALSSEPDWALKLLTQAEEMDTIHEEAKIEAEQLKKALAPDASTGLYHTGQRFECVQLDLNIATCMVPRCLMAYRSPNKVAHLLIGSSFVQV